MRVFLVVVALAALVFGVLAILAGPSDIQLGIGVNAILSAVVLLGLASVMRRIRGLRPDDD